MRNMIRLLLLLPLLCSVVNGANILAFFHNPAISHQFVFRSIVKELSLRGHSVTFVTSDPMKDAALTNITEVDISASYQIFQNLDASTFSREATNLINMGILGLDFAQNLFKIQMEVDGVKEILKKPKDTYDLVLIEVGNPLYSGLKHKFKAPLIAISSYGIPSYLHELLGNPTHPFLYVDIFSKYLDPLESIWGKIDSLYIYLVNFFLGEFLIFPSSDKLARSYFGNDMPYIKDLVRDTSLTIANVNPIISDRRPLAPNVVEVWNLHLNRVESSQKFEDIQKILDGAKEGVVYFSLGTNVRFDHVQGNFKEAVLKALGQLPYTVLCKWESDDHPEKPKNVILRKWFPQQSIMAHPNLKVFVTQGGLQSAEEAIINGVPLVIIPFLGDQPKNAKIFTKQGMAETISPRAVNEHNLKETILKVAGNERYRIRAKEIRSIFLDQPRSGLDTIMWWCDYVMRHKGAKHLKSPGAEISFYEYFLLDVLALFLVAFFVLFKTVKLLWATLIGLLRGSKQRKESKKKNK